MGGRAWRPVARRAAAPRAEARQGEGRARSELRPFCNQHQTQRARVRYSSSSGRSEGAGMDEMRNRHDDRRMRLPTRRPDEEFRTLSSSIRVEIAACSRPGSRSANADHYHVVRLGRHQETIATSLPEGDVPARFDEAAYGIFVADGTGAVDSGETASRLAISTLAHLALHFARWNVRIDPRTADDVIHQGLRFYRRVDDLRDRGRPRESRIVGHGHDPHGGVHRRRHAVHRARRTLARLSAARRLADAVDSRSDARPASRRGRPARRRPRLRRTTSDIS